MNKSIKKIGLTDNYVVNTDKQAQVATLQEKIDRLVYALYGLTADLAQGN